MQLFFAFWTHNLSPFLGPHWGGFGIRYYSLAYPLGALAGLYLLKCYARAGRTQIPEDKITELVVITTSVMMTCGRVGVFLFYHLDQLLDDPLVLFRLQQGGMSAHGGFIGVIIALWWVARSEKLPFLHLGDVIGSVASAGILFGRLANFINGELWGKTADVPWAVVFFNSGGGPLPRHPSQLYEAALEGAFLLTYMQWRYWRSDVVQKQPGRLMGEFFLVYALVRMICEIFREPDLGVAPIFGLSRGTFYSLFLAIAGAVLVIYAQIVLLRKKRQIPCVPPS